MFSWREILECVILKAAPTEILTFEVSRSPRGRLPDNHNDTSVLKPSAESLGVTPLRNVAYRCGFLFVLHVEKEMQYSGPHEYVGQALGRKRRHF
ncbi:hypothetical protein Y032_0042g561 [Ancylostoma ceylanicum]|uniref:Uncharacterized protein n=1 Tax=Ancylostoma ceylanicum TaxID=53326 RepID=A0A016UF89_9BILA|nr:hypothetical protein Y032_0042g561 [Ancylostoma ceylanicum]